MPKQEPHPKITAIALPVASKTNSELLSASEYCRRLDIGLDLIRARYPEDVVAIDRVRNLLIGKSCLLDRLIYCGEEPSQTPCPVHQGAWSGIHLGWPGQRWSDGRPVPVAPRLAEWVAAGCRCYQHKCGCTTGWQPDEHCGCGGRGA